MDKELDKAIVDYIHSSISTSLEDAFRAGAQYQSKETRKLVLETRISERKQCVYIIEQDLMDHAETDEAYSEDYIGALQDEVKNHQNFIMDYEKELNQLKG